jgi:hypothetical protein
MIEQEAGPEFLLGLAQMTASGTAKDGQAAHDTPRIYTRVVL